MNGMVSTTENVAVFCWEQLVGIIPQPARLYQVKIWETGKNIVTYRGEE
jgi:6-pyruvoyltetrahydropterin/6-carboxytetrahydropterin synthase